METVRFPYASVFIVIIKKKEKQNIARYCSVIIAADTADTEYSFVKLSETNYTMRKFSVTLD